MKTKLFLLSLALLALHLGARAQDTSIVFGTKFYISGKVSQGGTGIVYQWQRNGKDIAGANDTAYTTDSTLVPGFYTYVRKSVCEQCGGRWQYSNPHTIRVICPTPVQPSKIGGAVTTQCAGSSYTYTVSAITGYTFNWALPAGWKQTAGTNTNSITVTTGDAAGTINVTPVQDSSGCLGKARDSTIATVNKRPTLTLATANKDQTITPGNNIANIVYTIGGDATTSTIAWTGQSATPGFSFDAATATISGATTSATAGSYNYTVTATVASCPNATAPGTITATTCPSGSALSPTSGTAKKCYTAVGSVAASSTNCPTNYTKTTDLTVANSLSCPLNGVRYIWGVDIRIAFQGTNNYRMKVGSCPGGDDLELVSQNDGWYPFVKGLGAARDGTPSSGTANNANVGILCVRNF